MSKNTKISVAQLFILLFLSRMIVTVTYSTYVADISKMWCMSIASLCGLILTLVMVLPVYFLYRTDNRLTVADNGYALLGRGGAVIAIIYGFYFLWVILYTLSLFNLFVTDLMNPSISVIALSVAVVIASAYGAWKGIEAIARTSTIILFAVIIALIFVICTLFNKIDVYNYTPINWGNGGDIGDAVLSMLARNSCIPAMAMLLPFANGKIKRGIVAWGVFVYFTIAVMVFIIVGVLGDYLKTQVFPVYSLTSLAQWGVLQRLDGAFLGIWTAGIFIKAALMIYLISACVKRIWGEIAGRISIVASAVVVLVVSLLFSTNSNIMSIFFNNYILIAATGITAVVIPLLLLIIKKIKQS